MRLAAMIVAVALGSGAAHAEIGNIVVTEAASFQKGYPSPGSIASIFCTGLAGISGIVTAGYYPLPRELAGVRVRMGGVAAPLVAVAQLNGYQQINIQVPLEVRLVSLGDIDVTIEQEGRQTTVRVSQTGSPGEFFRLADGNGAFQHADDYRLVSAENPARPGEVVIGYLTGIGTTIPVVPTGQAAPADPPAVVSLALRGTSRPLVEISVGEPPNQKVVAPLFLGLAPGLAGVYQVNFQVPEGLLQGNRPVKLVTNACVRPPFGGTACLAVYPADGSLPVPMAVR